MKQCRKCKKIYPRSGFNKDRSKKDGLKSHCKICVSKSRAKNKAQKKEIDRQYYLNNLEKVSARKVAYRAKNKDKISDYGKAYYYKNQDSILEKKRAYKKEIREKLEDPYIKQLIIKSGWNLSVEDIPDDLVQLRRLQVKISRKLKSLSNET